jgi:DNA-binding transcriptional MerR regulator/effector-binding domain-containing protein
VYSIGEFSKITGITVKTLRFYHDEGLLVPSLIDPQTGYRYYAASKVEVARVISQLRQLDFTLADIAEVLAGCDDDADLLAHLERQRQTIAERLRSYRAIGASLDRIITHEREAQAAMNTVGFEVVEKSLAPQLVAGIRMQGRYSDCGQAFARLGRQFGRFISGKPLLLHYDTEYKEADADFEACFPIRQGSAREGISIRELPGGKGVTLMHRGPYDELGRSYCRIVDYVKQHGYEIASPTREVYIKGPGMIFRGNPKKYLTEIQMLVME